MAEQVLPPSPPITGVNGVYVPGAMVYFYRSGTDTLLDVFSDQAEGTQIANPVIADSNGRIVQTFIDPSETVRITVHDATDTLLYELDEAPFALTQTVNATDITHTPTALNTATNVAAAIASSDARAQTKAPKNSPVFTGTISGVSLGLSGAMTAASGAFSGALSAASAAITGAITATSATISGTVTSARQRITATNDVTLSSTNHPFQIGNDAAENVVMDTNEIQARNNGATSPYYVNPLGGDVVIGKDGGTETTIHGTVSGLNQDQAWADVTGFRVANTSYTNNTSMHIDVAVTVEKTEIADPLLVVGPTAETVIAIGRVRDANGLQTLYARVPVGHVYACSFGDILEWKELR